jgi:tricorn protease
LLFIVTVAGAAEEAHLLRWADVHGDRIVFTDEDDLWVVSSAGGEARRMTCHPAAARVLGWHPDGTRVLCRLAAAGTKRRARRRTSRTARRARGSDA